MKSKSIYSQVKLRIKDDLPNRVFEALKNYVGKKNRVLLRDLAVEVYGCPPASTTQMRHVREAIAVLRKNRVAVCYDPHLPGYFLAANEAEKEVTIKANQSRINEMQDANNGLRNAIIPVPEYEKMQEKMI
jgi:hypothetical protein